MAEIVNLNRVRKKTEREQEVRRAEANRVRFGRTKAEKARAAAEGTRRRAELDGKKMEKTDP